MPKFSIVTMADIPGAKPAAKSEAHKEWATQTIKAICAAHSMDYPATIDILPRRAKRSDSSSFVEVSEEEYNATDKRTLLWRKRFYIADRARAERESRENSTGITHYGFTYRSGLIDGGRIRVSYGTDWHDFQMVVLHEVAHWLTQGESHSAEYFKVAFNLYDAYGISRAHYLKRETEYKVRAATKAARTTGRRIPR